MRNSGVRTLFLAMGSHGGKFSAATLRECVWDMLLPLVGHCHNLSETSSNEEIGASELGKDKGEQAMLLRLCGNSSSVAVGGINEKDMGKGDGGQQAWRRQG